MTTIGIDPSSKGLHIVVGHDDIAPEFWVRHEIKFGIGGPYSPERAQAAYEKFDEYLQQCVDTMPDASRELNVWIEAPVVGRGGVKTAMVQAYVSGALQAVALKYGSVRLVNVSTWKKNVIGSGSADKDKVKRHMRFDFGIPADLDQDFYDATAICIYGSDASKRAAKLGKPGSL